MKIVNEIKREIAELANPQDAAILQRFFKTGLGQYGEGDVFVGVKIPPLRAVAKFHKDTPLEDVVKLLQSPVHEHRIVALLIMVWQSQKGSDALRQRVYEAYLANTAFINNWDLVDLSCRDVVGGYLQDISREPLYILARSESLWERRIAMVSTWQFIRVGDLDDTCAIATLLLGDKHDLIHKAVGWMLREAGKKDEARLRAFLDEYATRMPRTALRYAIERLDQDSRVAYMKRP